MYCMYSLPGTHTWYLFGVRETVDVHDEDRFLRSTRYCAVDADLIQARAEELSRDTERETSRAIFRFVRDTIQYNIRRRIRGAERVLTEQEGMCFDKTNLSIALHRANDIPARYREMRCTLKVRDDDLPAEAFHLVPEARIGGDWVVQDPSFDDSVAALIAPSEWGEPTWERIETERRYAELPFYLPYLINYLVVPFSGKVRRIQAALDGLDR